MLSGKRSWKTVCEWKVPEGTIDVSLTRFLEEAVKRCRDRPVMTFRGRETSYERLWEASERLAAALSAEGVSKGDRVALMMPNCPEYVISFFAVRRTPFKARHVKNLREINDG